MLQDMRQNLPQSLPQNRVLLPRESIQPFVVSMGQMQQIEQRLFEAGMPVAALMEKVAGRLTHWFLLRSGLAAGRSASGIGVLAGPGHNGGDALVMARELHHLGYGVSVYQPFEGCKSLTAQHASYCKSLGIPFVTTVAELVDCEAIIDGGFGFGLTRPITGELAEDIRALNQQNTPIFSIDLPSGIHTDTGQVMGVALKAKCTACLGLWKRGFMAAEALAYLGKCDLIDFDIPLAAITAVLDDVSDEGPSVRRITADQVLAPAVKFASGGPQKADDWPPYLPLDRGAIAHKYTAGHLLLIAGSRQYAGAALLAGLGAVASGVGMLTLAVPESIRLALLPQLPGALLVGCPETTEGAIARLPNHLTLEKYDAIALGPGLTPTVPTLLAQVMAAGCPLLLDADGLNLLAKGDPIQQLQHRAAPTILTPHDGEFKRLFPSVDEASPGGFAAKLPAEAVSKMPGEAALKAAQASSAIILLKGPRSAVAHGQRLWFNPESTVALARGGSGDVLTGLMGGLLAAQSRQWPGTDGAANADALVPSVLGAVWWHSQAAIVASDRRTVLGVDPLHLAQALNPALQERFRQHACASNLAIDNSSAVGF
ncbi:MAG: NAD(P)H-hydrate dehydratase [Cyanobacteria bacterium J06598_3]